MMPYPPVLILEPLLVPCHQDEVVDTLDEADRLCRRQHFAGDQGLNLILEGSEHVANNLEVALVRFFLCLIEFRQLGLPLVGLPLIVERLDHESQLADLFSAR